MEEFRVEFWGRPERNKLLQMNGHVFMGDNFCRQDKASLDVNEGTMQKEVKSEATPEEENFLPISKTSVPPLEVNQSLILKVEN